MAILSAALALIIITFYVGPTGLYRKNHAENVFNDFLTVNQIEDSIRKIRLENQALEEELAQLSGSESSN